jgi:hypothetical protein
MDEAQDRTEAPTGGQRPHVTSGVPPSVAAETERAQTRAR